MSGRIRERVASLEGQHPPELTRLVLRDLGGGRYSHRGTGRVYTRDEVARLGDAVLIVETAVVHARRETEGA